MVCNSPMQTNGDEVVMVNETELEEMKQCISGEFQLFFLFSIISLLISTHLAMSEMAAISH